MKWSKKKTKWEQIIEGDELIDEITRVIEENHPDIPAIQKGLRIKLIYLGMIK